ncbi:hypothetical protein BDW02DRAFT_527609, partial [Decorospora gaudefroyi]
MASGFWAAGNNKVKASNSLTPTVTEAAPKMAASSQKVVLKGMSNGHGTNGATNGNTPKFDTPSVATVSWDEDVDDTNFVVTPFQTKVMDTRLVTFNTTIKLKDERVKELEATVVTKILRIEELEVAVEDKDHVIGDLEANIEFKDTQIKQLEKENTTQYLQVQELVGEVDERDRRIKQLEAELEDKATIIGGFEKHVLTIDAEALSAKDVKDTSVGVQVNLSQGPAERKTVVKQAVSEITSQLKVSAAEESNETLTTKTTRGTSCGESGSPTFVTKDTLKVVPPAPRPKTLTFPIDLSKFGKKPAAQKSTKSSTSPSNGKNGHTTPWGHASKLAGVKTDTMPKFNPSADIRHMLHGERVVFANGPDVIVKLGDVKLATIPKYVLMQCSKKALQYFTENPEATSWVFPAGSMDADAAKAHLSWMDEMTYQGRVYSLTLNAASVYDKKNLRICRAARVMGLNNTYVGHFTKQFCDRIRNQNASLEFMDTICELAYPENDPVFECLANNIVNQKRIGAHKDTAGLEKLLAKHALLKQKMEQIEK